MVTEQERRKLDSDLFETENIGSPFRGHVYCDDRAKIKVDIYRVLGVDRSATDEEIKRAYKQAARTAHPDRHKDDPTAAARFNLIAKAFATLSNPELRDIYDRLWNFTYPNPGPNVNTGFHTAQNTAPNNGQAAQNAGPTSAQNSAPNTGPTPPQNAAPNNGPTPTPTPTPTPNNGPTNQGINLDDIWGTPKTSNAEPGATPNTGLAGGPTLNQHAGQNPPPNTPNRNLNAQNIWNNLPPIGKAGVAMAVVPLLYKAVDAQARLVRKTPGFLLKLAGGYASFAGRTVSTSLKTIKDSVVDEGGAILRTVTTPFVSLAETTADRTVQGFKAGLNVFKKDEDGKAIINEPINAEPDAENIVSGAWYWTKKAGRAGANLLGTLATPITWPLRKIKSKLTGTPMPTPSQPSEPTSINPLSRAWQHTKNAMKWATYRTGQVLTPLTAAAGMGLVGAVEGTAYGMKDIFYQKAPISAEANLKELSPATLAYACQAYLEVEDREEIKRQATLDDAINFAESKLAEKNIDPERFLQVHGFAATEEEAAGGHLNGGLLGIGAAMLRNIKRVAYTTPKTIIFGSQVQKTHSTSPQTPAASAETTEATTAAAAGAGILGTLGGAMSGVSGVIGGAFGSLKNWWSNYKLESVDVSSFGEAILDKEVKKAFDNAVKANPGASYTQILYETFLHLPPDKIKNIVNSGISLINIESSLAVLPAFIAAAVRNILGEAEEEKEEEYKVQYSTLGKQLLKMDNNELGKFIEACELGEIISSYPTMHPQRDLNHEIDQGIGHLTIGPDIQKFFGIKGEPWLFDLKTKVASIKDKLTQYNSAKAKTLNDPNSGLITAWLDTISDDEMFYKIYPNQSGQSARRAA
ncbi:J domain-containing protein [Patescibacteria group bacterium]|nr:J domain-containing protein [Patescibacteria group bacterium]